MASSLSTILFMALILFAMGADLSSALQGNTQNTKDQSKRKTRKIENPEEGDAKELPEKYPLEEPQCVWSPNLRKWKMLRLNNEGTPELTDESLEESCPPSLPSLAENGINTDDPLDLLLLLQLFPMEEIEQLLEDISTNKKKFPGLSGNINSINFINNGGPYKKPTALHISNDGKIQNINLEEIAAMHEALASHPIVERLLQQHAQSANMNENGAYIAPSTQEPPLTPEEEKNTEQNSKQTQQPKKVVVEEPQEPKKEQPPRYKAYDESPDSLTSHFLSFVKFLFNGFIVYLCWSIISRCFGCCKGAKKEKERRISNGHFKGEKISIAALKYEKASSLENTVIETNKGKTEEEKKTSKLIELDGPSGKIEIDPRKLAKFKDKLLQQSKKEAEENKNGITQKPKGAINPIKTKKDMEKEIATSVVNGLFMPWRKCNWKLCTKTDIGLTKKFQICANCLLVRYCCKEHQVMDWTSGNHKDICKLTVLKLKSKKK